MDAIFSKRTNNGLNYIKREALTSEAIAEQTCKNIVACADECLEIIREENIK